MTHTWAWNDPKIGADETLFRHVPKGVGAKQRIDPTTGRWSLTPAAFTVEEMREDGWSVYREELLRRHDLTTKAIEESGSEPREVWNLTVRDARSGENSGVIDEVDEAGGKLGLTHGLIRFDKPKPDKERIRRLRTWLIEHARRE